MRIRIDIDHSQISDRKRMNRMNQWDGISGVRAKRSDEIRVLIKFHFHVISKPVFLSRLKQKIEFEQIMNKNE